MSPLQRTVILVGTSLLAAILLVSFAPAYATQATCPDGNGWVKIDSDDLSLYPVSGAVQFCFKAGSDNSQGAMVACLILGLNPRELVD